MRNRPRLLVACCLLLVAQASPVHRFYIDIPCSMADHIATRKSTFTSASASRMTRTHSPIVNGSQKRVGVYSNGVTYGAMSKQTQAEPCVLYIRVSTTRQANQGVSLKAQIARGKLHAQYQNFFFQIRTSSLIVESESTTDRDAVATDPPY